MMQIFESRRPNADVPVLTIEFPRPPAAPALELHLWVEADRSHVAWVTEDGDVLGIEVAASC
jgi:hypothetical protein